MTGRGQTMRERVEALRDRFVEAGKPPDYSEFDRGVAAAYRDVALRLTEALDADDAREATT